MESYALYLIKLILLILKVNFFLKIRLNLFNLDFSPFFSIFLNFSVRFYF